MTGKRWLASYALPGGPARCSKNGSFLSDNAAAKHFAARSRGGLILRSTTIARLFDEATPDFVGIPAGRRFGRRHDGRLSEAVADLIGIGCRDRLDEAMDVADRIGGVAHKRILHSRLSLMCPEGQLSCF